MSLNYFKNFIDLTKNEKIVKFFKVGNRGRIGFLLITNLKIIFLRSKGKDHFIQDLKFDLDSGVIVGKT
ncbi:MAG: hypothetical protein ACTSVE_14630, partial [Candidatus Helarchaeota archaeon]